MPLRHGGVNAMRSASAAHARLTGAFCLTVIALNILIFGGQLIRAVL